MPSNEIDPVWASTVAQGIEFSGGTTTIDTTMGEIRGAFTRPAGTGVKAGILFVEHISQGAAIGVFGAGAAGASVAGAGKIGSSTSNGGGGGGGAGRVLIRSISSSTTGLTSSPPAQTAAITTN